MAKMPGKIIISLVLHQRKDSSMSSIQSSYARLVLLLTLTLFLAVIIAFFLAFIIAFFLSVNDLRPRLKNINNKVR